MSNDDIFHHYVHRLYYRIICETGPTAPAPLMAILQPSMMDHRILLFDAALQKVVQRVNSILGPGYLSMRFEGDHRWSILGTERAEWMDFQYLSPKNFKVTKFLRGASSVICSFRHNGVEMENDIHNAFKIMAQCRSN